VVRIVKVEVKVAEKDVFARTCTAVVKEEVKVRKEKRVGELVSRAGRGAVDAEENDGLARQCQRGLDEFKRRVSKWKWMRKGEVRSETVFVNYGNASPSRRARGGKQTVATRSDAGNDGFVASWVKPRFGYHNTIKVVVCDKVRNHLGFTFCANGLRIKKA
jgi:hypothetical protein